MMYSFSIVVFHSYTYNPLEYNLGMDSTASEISKDRKDVLR